MIVLAVILALIGVALILWATGFIEIKVSYERLCSFCRQPKDTHAPDCQIKDRPRRSP
jgi:hypothetical protein